MTQNLTNQPIIDKLVRFLEQALSTFTKSEEFASIQVSDEDAYTNALRTHLQEEARYMEDDYGIFSFDTQVGQSKSKSGRGKARTVDIGVKHTKQRKFYIFAIEAKFLPPPPKDYVLGNTGAIKRFKKLEHGTTGLLQKNYYSLDESAIVAYVRDGDVNANLVQINTQISQLIKDNNTTFGLEWTDNELLGSPVSQNISNTTDFAYYTSKHKRIDGSEITLHHFWIKL